VAGVRQGETVVIDNSSFFFPLFLFSHYTLSPRVHWNANVFISSTANQCALRAHKLVCMCGCIYIVWTLTSFAFETRSRAANTTAKLSRNFSDAAVINGILICIWLSVPVKISKYTRTSNYCHLSSLSLLSNIAVTLNK